uniref:Uncharacterized protein n=1 Tax=Aegilops tauschii TaxID=37682 RepID=M8C6Q3_AEGTA
MATTPAVLTLLQEKRNNLAYQPVIPKGTTRMLPKYHKGDTKTFDIERLQGQHPESSEQYNLQKPYYYLFVPQFYVTSYVFYLH